MIKLVDFGLVILIWMTQLIVYPSFTYYQTEDLLAWHSKYTVAVSIIVMPLMFAQVALHGYGLFHDFTWWRALNAVLIGLVWVNTFLFAVPLHNQIGAETEVTLAASKLVKVNWYRTILWTLVFVISMLGEKLSMLH